MLAAAAGGRVSRCPRRRTAAGAPRVPRGRCRAGAGRRSPPTPARTRCACSRSSSSSARPRCALPPTTAHAIDCAIRTEVLPHLAAAAPTWSCSTRTSAWRRSPSGRAAPRPGRCCATASPACHGQPFPCATLAALTAIDGGYAPRARLPRDSLPAAGAEARPRLRRRHRRVRARVHGHDGRRGAALHLYVIASNTQAPFRLTRNPAAVAALRNPATPGSRASTRRPSGVAYDQTFLWGPRVVHRHAPAPLANLLADNYKVPLTTLRAGARLRRRPVAAAPPRVRNLRPVPSPAPGRGSGIATSLPAFEYGHRDPARTRATTSP